MIRQHPTPTRQFSGKDFQDVLKPRVEEMRAEGLASLNISGTQADVIERYADGSARCWIHDSFPDYQGVFARPHAREVLFDLKVCSQSSFDLSKYRIETKADRSRQLRTMYERSEHGSVCFFLLHWNARTLKTKSDEAATYAFPVTVRHPFWTAFERREEKAIRRVHCEQYAIHIPWITIGRGTVPRPDLFLAITEAANAIDSGNCLTVPRAILRTTKL